MTSFISPPKFKAAFWLLIMALSTAAGDVVCSEVNTDGTVSERCIGDALDLIRLPQLSRGRKLLRNQDSPRPKRDFSIAPSLANRRSLLQALCSGTKNDDDAIITCTNAVRADPRAFDYPCESGWVYNYDSRGPFSRNEQLTTAAKKHSEYQANRGDISHTGSDDSSVADRASEAGYPIGAVTENVASGYNSARSVVFGWMCSPGHRRNIMSCETIHIGVGVVNGNGRPYHTQVFGCPRGVSCTCSGDPNNAPPPASTSQQTQQESPKPDSLPSQSTPQTSFPFSGPTFFTDSTDSPTSFTLFGPSGGFTFQPSSTGTPFSSSDVDTFQPFKTGISFGSDSDSTSEPVPTGTSLEINPKSVGTFTFPSSFSISSDDNAQVIQSTARLDNPRGNFKDRNEVIFG